MRLIIWLAVPVGLLALAAVVTINLEMTTGSGYCTTWLSLAFPYCRSRTL